MILEKCKNLSEVSKSTRERLNVKVAGKVLIQSKESSIHLWHRSNLP